MAEDFQQRFAAALARRAAQREGLLRAQLDARLAALPVRATAPARPPAASPERPGRAALSALLQQMAARRAAAPQAPAETALLELRRTWSRLHADQRLAQARASLPANAGPLNSLHLVHRALALMRALSPDYFERFVGHAETLLWLEQGQPPRKPPGGRRA